MTPKTIQLFDNEYYIIYQHENLTTIWELQDYFPIMEEDVYKQLKNDIKKNGLNDPILYYTTEEGINLVIDGNRRLKICMELELTNIPTKKIKENFGSLEDIRFWMVKNQCQRRNLTIAEKLRLACLHEETIVKKAKENLSRGGRGENVVDNVDTILEIAKLAGVGRTTTARFKAVMKSGLTVIMQQMLKGNLSIASADLHVRKYLKKNASIEVKTDVKMETKTRKESEQIQSEAKKPQYVKDIYEGKHLLKENKVEYLIMAKDQDKLNDFISQQPSLNCAIFIMED
ncbi:ParB family chromosome partitioning protein [Chryseobacterium sp. 7]|uniref:ParB N-terminal domain-containing protein n=1 Tax=Chryseobacterium sp. 7 TaxID=2035214 RepID=UPI000EABE4A3|nr:ParB N-terminal domain-containing protein [Chryseobacterium sp. 7]RLJ33822.1 ParB family chromosome partitioning protein [Chryseobacterium sp. 7]